MKLGQAYTAIQMQSGSMKIFALLIAGTTGILVWYFYVNANYERAFRNMQRRRMHQQDLKAIKEAELYNQNYIKHEEMRLEKMRQEERIRLKEIEERNLKERVHSEIISAIGEHKHALYSERRRMTEIDAYGNTDDGEWRSEGVKYFMLNVLFKRLEYLKVCLKSNGYGPFIQFRDGSMTTKADIYEMITEALSSLDRPIELPLKDVALMSGIEYEEYCGALLVLHGWRVETTSVSGDQGVDLIATNSNIRACIQCKRYSAPIGNSAVQEIIAGMLYWSGSHAVVIGSSSFTKSAKQLAQSSNILLLHHEEIPFLQERLTPSTKPFK